MDAERWTRAEEVFERALRLDSAERGPFVHEACGGDAGLRELVLEMLDGDRAAALPEPPRPGTDDRNPHGEDVSGSVIGNWRLERRIGSGGMGSVYLASRVGAEFEQRVALKLIKRGMDTDDILRRFRNERRVLADLEHPGIARLIDGGATDDGLPFLVMEYVEGHAIDEWCDERDLGVRERLELFVKVCEAVQHAHEQHVVHRDLKPANVLVTSAGAPKLLDFGISKVLDASGSSRTVDVTATELRLMTPEYAAPEQVRGGGVTAATDVYGLGVILYELLTGHRPYLMTTRLRGDIERIICEEDPVRPSVVVKRSPAPEPGTRRGTTARRLRAQLAGDLDTIVMMALRKEPERRYANAGELAADITGMLEGQPVRARPDTWTYRTSKFVRRNRVLVASTLAIVFVLVGALIVSTSLYLRAERQRVETERRAYLTEISAAALALRTSDVRAARKRLQRAPIHLRGWEWRHLWARLDRSERTFGHGGVVRTVAVSPDNTLIASGGENWQLRIWDLEQGVERWSQRHQRSVSSVAFSPDGRWVGSVAQGTSIHLWDVASGEEMWSSGEGETEPTGIAFDPSGEWLVTGDRDGSLTRRRVGDGARIERLVGHQGSVTYVGFSPKTARLLSASSDGSIRLWPGGSAAAPLVLSRAPGVLHAALDPGEEIVAALYGDGSIRSWDAVSGELLHEFLNASISNRGKLGFLIDHGGVERLVSADSARGLAIWDLETGTLLSTFPGHEAGVQALASAPDGCIVTGSADGTVKLWRADAEDVRTFQGRARWWHALAMGRDGEPLVTPDMAPLSFHVWDPRTGVTSWRGALEEGGPLAFALSPDERLLATCSGGVLRVWDVKSRSVIVTLENDERPSSFMSAAFDPGGRLLVSGTREGDVHVWNVATWRLERVLEEPENRVGSLAFDPKGESLLAGSWDHRAYVWDVGNWVLQRTLEGHSEGVYDVAWSRDGSAVATVSFDHTGRLLDARNWKERAVLRGHSDRVYCVDFTADGRLLATGSNDRTIRLWDAATGDEVVTLHGHQSRVHSVAFAADGTLLVSLARDGAVKLWDAPHPVDD